MDVVLIGISGAIALALAVWTVVREDASTARRGRHRGSLRTLTSASAVPRGPASA
ncbi:hypothetical protein [Sinomonas sp. P10A9]|uniref:Secreted protein with PEP-CTERM sorting signal n=1 Tax=Sinomonas puerhi TaxID=3238584 RepID=A0AB39KZH3_9MICC